MVEEEVGEENDEGEEAEGDERDGQEAGVEEKAAFAAELRKLAKQQADELREIGKVLGAEGGLLAKVKEVLAERDRLARLPAPAKGRLLAVDKLTDVSAFRSREDDPAQPVLNKDGSVNREATALKQIKHAQRGALG